MNLWVRSDDGGHLRMEGYGDLRARKLRFGSTGLGAPKGKQHQRPWEMYGGGEGGQDSLYI